MLYPKSTQERLVEEHIRFKKAYLKTIGDMRSIMEERGEVRDSLGAPIFYRQGPEELLALAKLKLQRIELVLSRMSKVSPSKRDLSAIKEECIDSSNYLLFLTALCLLCLEDQAQ